VIGVKLRDNALDERSKMPGPAAYSPYIDSGSPKFRIGTGHRSSFENKFTTGPGDYSPERNLHSTLTKFPRYGMGSSTREPLKA